MPRLFRMAVVVIVSLSLLPLWQAAREVEAQQGDQLPNLLIPLTSEQATAQAAAPGDPTVVRTRAAEVQLTILDPSSGPTVGRRVALNFFEDVNFVAVLDLTGPSGPGRSVWTGKIEGDPYSWVTVATRDGAVSLEVLVGGISYQIRSTGGAIHSVRQVDPRLFPEDAPAPMPSREELQKNQNGDVVRPLVDSGAVIDVMIAYTTKTRERAGSTAVMNSEIDLAIARTNTTYVNSNINPRLRLVHTVEVTYTETGNSSTDLSALRNPSDGKMDNLHALRDTYGADLVGLIVESFDACGIGYLNFPAEPADAPVGFSAFQRSCAFGSYTVAHEFGHNMGAHHDRGVVAGNGSQNAANYGYVAPDKTWRTVMAYATTCNNCIRVPYFSNPDVLYQGVPMGIPSGQANAADNHSVLNSSAQTVANFRSSVVGSPTSTRTPTPLPNQPTSTRTPTQTAIPTATPPPVTSCSGGPVAQSALGAGPELTKQPVGQQAAGDAATKNPIGASLASNGVKKLVKSQSPAKTQPARVGAQAPLPGYATVACETWESGGVPANWVTFDNDGATNGNICWATTAFHKRFGNRSMWPAGGCANGVDPTQFFYPHNTASWLVYGPFSLADASAAQVNFSLWSRMEEGYDFLYWAASVDGDTFFGDGVSGNSTSVHAPTTQGWLDVVFDLTDVPEMGSLTGQQRVWIAFVFESDISNTDDGPFIDDVLIQKRVSTQATAIPTATVPTGASTLGGKNIGIIPGGTSATVIWDGGNLQNGYLAARYLPTFSFLPQSPLSANATSVSDGGFTPNGLYCYIVGPTSGSPPNLAGLSSFVCMFANTRSGASQPQNYTLRVTQSSNASLTWTAPSGGLHDGFRISQLSGPTVDVDANTLSRSFPMSGFNCFTVTAMRQGAPIGNTDAACGLPFSNLGASTSAFTLANTLDDSALALMASLCSPVAVSREPEVAIATEPLVREPASS